MAPPPWATAEQQEFLKGRRAEYQQHQAQKTLAIFWPVVYRDFFLRWPIAENSTPADNGPEDVDSEDVTGPEQTVTESVRKVSLSEMTSYCQALRSHARCVENQNVVQQPRKREGP